MKGALLIVAITNLAPDGGLRHAAAIICNPATDPRAYPESGRRADSGTGG